MASTWDIISSTLVLAVFLAAAYGITLLLSSLSSTSASTRTSLQQKGVNYENGRLSVKTDKAAPTREEYIAQTQRAFEKGGRMMAQHPDAFAFKSGSGGGGDAGVSVGAGSSAQSSAMDASEKRGFQRGKKLA